MIRHSGPSSAQLECPAKCRIAHWQFAEVSFFVVMATPTRSNGSTAHGAFSSEASQPPHQAASAIPISDDIQKEEIQLQLNRVLSSVSFKNSRRQTDFLRLVVEMSLSGRSADIKERLIGIEVFGRPPDYDLTIDPIVRGAAVELRKRLAQYYADPKHSSELRLDLPLGTYVPAFRRPSPVQEREQGPADQLFKVEKPQGSLETVSPTVNAPPLPQKSKTRLLLVRSTIAATLLLSALLGVRFIYFGQSQSEIRALDAFWAPVTNRNDTILVCAGDLNLIMNVHPVESANETWRDVTKNQNHLDPNMGAALLQIGAAMGRKGKRVRLRLADLTPLSDLREQPDVFIGGANNPWTVRILSGLRFRNIAGTDPETGRPADIGMIVDMKNPAQTSWRLDFSARVNAITHDYSLVTRIQDPLTGQPVVLLTGLGAYGNSSASEFVSNPAYFWQFAKDAPKSWEERTVQIVLETTVVDGRVSTPKVVAEQIY